MNNLCVYVYIYIYIHTHRLFKYIYSLYKLSVDICIINWLIMVKWLKCSVSIWLYLLFLPRSHIASVWDLSSAMSDLTAPLSERVTRRASLWLVWVPAPLTRWRRKQREIKQAARWQCLLCHQVNLAGPRESSSAHNQWAIIESRLSHGAARLVDPRWRADRIDVRLIKVVLVIPDSVYM